MAWEVAWSSGNASDSRNTGGFAKQSHDPSNADSGPKPPTRPVSKIGNFTPTAFFRYQAANRNQCQDRPETSID
jgi:hypothetical protein